MSHHCGTCGCCGGDIPCGADYERKWRGDGQCPGNVNRDGTCGALRSVERRDDPPMGERERADRCGR
jgi:hypothetical protein